jgi:hypothetical protein
MCYREIENYRIVLSVENTRESPHQITLTLISISDFNFDFDFSFRLEFQNLTSTFPQLQL